MSNVSVSRRAAPPHLGHVVWTKCSSFARGEPPSALVLDLQRVNHLDTLIAPLLADLVMRVRSRGGAGVGWADVGQCAHGLDAVDAALAVHDGGPMRRFEELDAAIEWCEDELLAELGARDGLTSVALEDHEIVAGLSAEDVSRLATVLDTRHWEPRESVVHAGQPAREKQSGHHEAFSLARRCLRP